MLGDTAVAVHPDPEAALDAVEKELMTKYAEAAEKDREAIESQLADLRERRAHLLPTLIKLRDMAKAGRQVMLPLVNRPIPLVADAWAKPELGSGCVKITPAHDPNDYEVAIRCDLPMINILRTDGTLNDEAGIYAGLTIPQARPRVVADLEALGQLGDVEDREIELPYSDRSKTPIEPFLADQWFVKMDTLAQSAMDAVSDESVKIFPVRYRKGYLDWLGEKRDWPVSRQLWWGHQIPIWSSEVMTPHDTTLLTNQIDKLKVNSDKLNYQVEHFTVASRRYSFAYDMKMRLWNPSWNRSASHAIPMCWILGSRQRYGLTVRWVGQSKPKNCSISIPPTRSSRRETSSPCGSLAWC